MWMKSVRVVIDSIYGTDHIVIVVVVVTAVVIIDHVNWWPYILRGVERSRWGEWWRISHIRVKEHRLRVVDRLLIHR
jgi:hypothetical protein